MSVDQGGLHGEGGEADKVFSKYDSLFCSEMYVYWQDKFEYQ